MTAVFVVTFVVLAFFVAPWVDARRDRDRRWAREHRVEHPTTPPRFTRDDPSPKPRGLRSVATADDVA